MGVTMSDDLGVIIDAKLNTTNDFIIIGEHKPLHGVERFSCWLNGWLPCRWRLGTVDGRWRFFRV